jgi:hypothetical protein
MAVTETCGECGAKRTAPEGDWNTVQAPALARWEREHLDEVHGDDEDRDKIMFGSDLDLRHRT